MDQLFTRAELRDFLGKHFRTRITFEEPGTCAIAQILNSKGYERPNVYYKAYSYVNNQGVREYVDTEPWCEEWQRQVERHFGRKAVTGRAALRVLDSIPEEA